MKKVSVIIPYYNSQQYFQETLSSVVFQSYQNLEILIIDDKSEPDSVKHLNNIVEQFNSQREIKVIHHEKNTGVAESRNTGLKKSTGEYIIFLDTDDVMCGKYSVEFRADFLDNHPHFDGTGGYSIKIDQNSQLINKQSPSSDFFNRAVQQPDDLLFEYCAYSIQHSEITAKVFFLVTGSCLLRKSSVESIYFDTNFDSEDDVEWTLRFLQAGKKLQLHKLPFHFWRIHDKQYHLQTQPETTKRVLTLMENILNKKHT